MGQGDAYITSGNTKNSETESREHETTLFAKRYVQIETNQQGRWSYNADGTIQYAGYAPKGLAEGTDGWLLQKFTYTSMRPVTRKIYYGNWSGKTSYTFE